MLNKDLPIAMQGRNLHDKDIYKMVLSDTKDAKTTSKRGYTGYTSKSFVGSTERLI